MVGSFCCGIGAEMAGIVGLWHCIAIGIKVPPTECCLCPTLLNELAKHLHILRSDKIVAIHKGDIAASGMVESGVACGTQSAVGLMHHAETIVARRPFVCYFAAVVGAAVVHHNHLQMGIRLAGNALQALLQIRAHIIHRHNHRYQRLFHTKKFCLTQIQQNF